MLRLLVTADDRSGALEAAAACADAGLTPLVLPWQALPVLGAELTRAEDIDCLVVDLGSRHLSGDEAATRCLSVRSLAAGRRVLKMDSTLRGNWPRELEVMRNGRRALVVPALPSLGRTCSGGVVLVRGVPVVESEFGADRRNPVRSSRPTDFCGGSLAAKVEEVRTWLTTSNEAVCVADALSDSDIRDIVSVIRSDDDAIVAGTSAVVGEVARVIVGASSRTMSSETTRAQRGPLAVPLVVVCGSRHPVSRRQAAVARGLPGVAVVQSPDDDLESPHGVAEHLADEAQRAMERTGARTVVLLGGDTAAAVLGTTPVLVRGGLNSGASWGTARLEGRDVEVVVKAGGFGNDRFVSDLVGEQ